MRPARLDLAGDRPPTVTPSEIWLVGPAHEMALVLDGPAREADDDWFAIVAVDSEVDAQTSTEPLLEPGDTTLGIPLRLRLDHQAPVLATALHRRVGALTEAGQDILRGALAGILEPERYGPPLTGTGDWRRQIDPDAGKRWRALRSEFDRRVLEPAARAHWETVGPPTEPRWPVEILVTSEVLVVVDLLGGDSPPTVRWEPGDDADALAARLLNAIWATELSDWRRADIARLDTTHAALSPTAGTLRALALAETRVAASRGGGPWSLDSALAAAAIAEAIGVPGGADLIALLTVRLDRAVEALDDLREHSPEVLDRGGRQLHEDLSQRLDPLLRLSASQPELARLSRRLERWLEIAFESVEPPTQPMPEYAVGVSQLQGDMPARVPVWVDVAVSGLVDRDGAFVELAPDPGDPDVLEVSLPLPEHVATTLASAMESSRSLRRDAPSARRGLRRGALLLTAAVRDVDVSDWLAVASGERELSTWDGPTLPDVFVHVFDPSNGAIVESVCLELSVTTSDDGPSRAAMVGKLSPPATGQRVLATHRAAAAVDPGELLGDLLSGLLVDRAAAHVSAKKIAEDFSVVPAGTTLVEAAAAIASAAADELPVDDRPRLPSPVSESTGVMLLQRALREGRLARNEILKLVGTARYESATPDMQERCLDEAASFVNSLRTIDRFTS